MIRKLITENLESKLDELIFKYIDNFLSVEKQGKSMCFIDEPADPQGALSKLYHDIAASFNISTTDAIRYISKWFNNRKASQNTLTAN